MSKTMMIVGLGNPGPRYAANRHNIGFQCVDRFAHHHAIPLSRVQAKARIGEGWVSRSGSQGSLQAAERQKILVVKPLTYMNLSGHAVASLVRYYGIELENMIVIHDDLDLSSGLLRLRRNGGSGGQNGVQSIIQQVASRDFHRVRVGIGRPPGRMDPAAYVLQNFSADEESIFEPLRERAVEALGCWLFEGIDAAMNRYNG